LPTERFESQALARPDEIAVLRTAVWRYANSLGASREVSDAVRLAVGEALTNIVMHAYLDRQPGEMSVRAWVDENDHLTVQVLDEGHGLVPRTDSPGLGLGLGVMAQIADDFRIANREGEPGTVVSLRFSLTDAESECMCGGPVG
jgi:serine/threonine-protein kinase RsbW